MRLSYCICGKIPSKLILACLFGSIVTWFVSWSICPKAISVSNAPREDDQANPDPQIYCADLVSTALREREDQEFAERKEREEKLLDNCPKSVPYETIDVVVNGGEKKIEGRIDIENNEPYVPFSFVKNYFEIYGGVQKIDKSRVLEWRHSYSDIHEITQEYDPKGSFLWFQGYHVEGRQRVICISGKEQVPVSSQWKAKGHFYPIQIAQYGLSHYSMMKVEGNSQGKTSVYEDGEADEHNWIGDTNDVKIVYDNERATRAIHFKTQGEFKLMFYCFLVTFRSEKQRE